MLLHGNMKRERERVIRNFLALHRAFTASPFFWSLLFLLFMFFFFCRTRRLTLIHIRILIHIQFFIVVAFVAFCFATRYVSCFANQQPTYPASASVPAPVPFPICSSMKMKGRDKSQVSQRILLLLGRWRKRGGGRGRENGSKRAKGVGFRLSITCNLNKLSVLWAFQFYALPPPAFLTSFSAPPLFTSSFLSHSLSCSCPCRRAY